MFVFARWFPLLLLCYLYVRNSDTIQKFYYIVLYFHEIVQYVATVRMLILKRETENSLLLYPHSKRY